MDNQQDPECYLEKCPVDRRIFYQKNYCAYDSYRNGRNENKHPQQTASLAQFRAYVVDKQFTQKGD